MVFWRAIKLLIRDSVGKKTNIKGVAVLNLVKKPAPPTTAFEDHENYQELIPVKNIFTQATDQLRIGFLPMNTK